MSQQISVLTLSIAASATLAANRFVTSGGAYPTAAANAFGVTQTSAADGDQVATGVLGTAVVTAGGAISKSASVEVGTDGKAVTHATGKVVAIALEAASADGESIEVFLIPNAS